MSSHDKNKKKDIQPGHKNKKKGHKPAHQNSFAFQHNVNSKKTKKILNSPNVGLCRRCTAKIDWRKKYRKYKPLTKPAVCNCCHQKEVKAAYHKACTPCSKQKAICAFCCRKWSDIDDNDEDHDHSRDLESEGLGAEDMEDEVEEDDEVGEDEGLVKEFTQMCLEVQAPFAAAMINGQKTVETRTYPLPDHLLNQPISIVETVYPTDWVGSKALPDVVPSGATSGPRSNWEGWKFGDAKTFPSMSITHMISFKSCFLYETAEGFRSDEVRHMVSSDSHFSPSPDTPVFGWEVDTIKTSPYARHPFPLLKRIQRSLFQVVDVEAPPTPPPTTTHLQAIQLPPTIPVVNRDANIHGRAPVVGAGGVTNKKESTAYRYA